jgi:hypothetical protein
MSRVLVLTVLVGVFAPACLASDDSLAKGAPGTYARRSGGLYSETVVLKNDGTYLFRFSFDMGSEQASGTWLVKDGSVILSPKKQGDLDRNKPSHFRIVVINHDLALCVIGKEAYSSDDTDPMNLFLPVKKANQSTDPTLASGTPPAEQESRHP